MSNQAITLDKPESKTWLIAALVLAMGASGVFASDMYLPSLPEITRVFASTSAMVQLTITVYFLGFALARLIFGPCSDRFGRRQLILTGFAVSLIGSIMCVYATSINALLLGRFIQGIGLSGACGLTRAVMRDTFDGIRLAKMASIFGLVFAMAPAVAPIVGGYLETYFNWQANFIFLFCYITLLALLIWGFLPETNKYKNRHATSLTTIWQNYKILLTNRTFMGYALCVSLSFSGVIAYITASPFLFLNILHLTPLQYGWLSVFLFVGMIIGRLINIYLVTKISLDKILLLGICCIVLSGLIMLLFALLGIINVSVILIPMVVYVIGTGFIMPNTLAGALSPFPKMAGTSGALYGCIQLLGSAIVSAIIAALHEKNQMALAIVITGLGIIAIMNFYLLIHRTSASAN